MRVSTQVSTHVGAVYGAHTQLWVRVSTQVSTHVGAVCEQREGIDHVARADLAALPQSAAFYLWVPGTDLSESEGED